MQIFLNSDSLRMMTDYVLCSYTLHKKYSFLLDFIFSEKYNIRTSSEKSKFYIKNFLKLLNSSKIIFPRNCQTTLAQWSQKSQILKEKDNNLMTNTLTRLVHMMMLLLLLLVRENVTTTTTAYTHTTHLSLGEDRQTQENVIVLFFSQSVGSAFGTKYVKKLLET